MKIVTNFINVYKQLGTMPKIELTLALSVFVFLIGGFILFVLEAIRALFFA